MVSLEKIKKDYSTLKKKYNLPEFSQLNEDFEIDRVSERETDYLLREVRKAMAEKTIALIRFFELFINPTNAPFFIFAILKNLSGSEKRDIEKMYQELCEIEVSAMSLDVKYSEKAEADYIKNVYKKWHDSQERLIEIADSINNAWKKSYSEKKEKGYLG